VHDVVAHGLSVISMQSGGALRVFDAEPERAREALRAIRATSRDALRELLDTFLVRSVLVPALLLDIGPRSWWPRGSSGPATRSPSDERTPTLEPGWRD
jgi:Histidine kinase